MTLNEAYQVALSLDDTTTTQDDSLRPHIVNWTNLFLVETFRNENAIREYYGRPLLKAMPSVSSMTDSVPYDDELVRSGLPFFLASQVAKTDADNAWASRYYDMYMNAINTITPILNTENKDVWG